MGIYIKDLEMPQVGFVEILIRDDGTVQQTGQSYRIDGTDYYMPYAGEMPAIYKAEVAALKRCWIPVSERLPELHMNVLVMDKAHDMAVGSLEKLWDGEVWVCPFSAVDEEQCPITHWMPLPEPPKEGE